MPQISPINWISILLMLIFFMVTNKIMLTNFLLSKTKGLKTMPYSKKFPW